MVPLLYISKLRDRLTAHLGSEDSWLTEEGQMTNVTQGWQTEVLSLHGHWL